MINLLLLNRFYRVISYRRVRKKQKATDCCVRSLVMVRESVWQNKWLNFWTLRSFQTTKLRLSNRYVRTRLHERENLLSCASRKRKVTCAYLFNIATELRFDSLDKVRTLHGKSVRDIKINHGCKSAAVIKRAYDRYKNREREREGERERERKEDSRRKRSRAVAVANELTNRFQLQTTVTRDVILTPLVENCIIISQSARLHVFRANLKLATCSSRVNSV